MLNMNKIVSVMLIFFFISGSFVTVAKPISASDVVEDFWSTKASMRYPRYYLGVDDVDGKIYAIGGYTKDGSVGTNERYDPATDTWVTLADMPTPRANFAIAAYQDEIYCIGGVIGLTTLDLYPFSQLAYCDAVEVYNTVSGTWSTKTFLPFYSADVSACVVDGKIFVIRQYWLYMYDPDTDTWTQRAQLPPKPRVF
jgi:N-acetylneuraminic acid mutarotase